MQYIKYTITTTVEAEDIISSLLYDLGVMGVEIEDTDPLSKSDKEAMFVDILEEEEKEGNSAFVSFYLDAAEDNELLLENIRNELFALKGPFAGELSISVEKLADEDYLNNWKSFFHQFYIDDILFLPSWEEIEPMNEAGEKGDNAPAPGKPSMVIHIDPGTAFGTGKHETTKLCIKLLRKYVKEGDKVLDIGTGSGILSIMALKFGAASAFGTDLDIAAEAACRDNFSKNDLEDSDFRLLIGNIIDDKRVQDEAGYDKYDIVVSNILAEVLLELTPEVRAHIKKGGIYILSGIIDEEPLTREEAEKAKASGKDITRVSKVDIVKEALISNGFSILEISREGKEDNRWAGIAAVYEGK